MMWVPIIPNETDITIIIIIMMVMIVMRKLQDQSSFFTQEFLNIEVYQLIFTDLLIRTTRLKLVKKKENNKQGHLEATKFKNKKIK